MQKFVGVLGAIAFAVAVQSSAVAQPSTIQVTVDPLSDTLEISETRWVSVYVDVAAESLKTCQIDVSYDGEVLKILNVVVGDLYSNSGHSVFFQDISVPDTVRGVMSVLGPNVSVDGPGEILRFEVSGEMEGLSLQEIQEAILLTADGAQHPFSSDSGTLYVRVDAVGVTPHGGRLQLSPLRQPSVGDVRLSYVAPGSESPILEWYDIKGRRQGRMTLSTGAGLARVRPGRAGVYWFVLRQEHQVSRARVVWLP